MIAAAPRMPVMPILRSTRRNRRLFQAARTAFALPTILPAADDGWLS